MTTTTYEVTTIGAHLFRVARTDNGDPRTRTYVGTFHTDELEATHAARRYALAFGGTAR